MQKRIREKTQLIIRFYKTPKIIAALKEEIKFLSDYIIDDVFIDFNIRKKKYHVTFKGSLETGGGAVLLSNLTGRI